MFTLREIEQNFFQLDEGISRDKRHLQTEHAMVAGRTHRDKTQRGRFGRSAQRGRGRGHLSSHHSSIAAASTIAAQHQSSIICFKCGEPGHIALACPTNNTQCPGTAPSVARGNAAAVQEGDSTSTSTSTATGRQTRNNALVCMARAIRYEHAKSARRRRTDRYVTMVLPINLGQFNDFLEDHLSTGLVPTAYMGDLNPHDDDFWLLLHNLPLAEQDRRHAAIIYPESESEQVIQHGVLPILRERFGLPIEAYPGCIQCFCMVTLLDHTFSTYRFMHCTQTASAPVTITCRHATLCITVYPAR